MRGDVSFTFLHRVEEVEQNIEDERWQSALALALTLPDICGGIAFPEIVKRYRDGRIMLDRQKNPTRDVGGQYIRWFDEYAGAYFKLSPTDEKPYICGDRCWQLRCEYLHQNKGFLNDENESPVRFHLGVNCGTSVCQLDQTTMNSDGMDIRIDIEQFCRRMCRAVRAYYEAVHTEKDFNIYNTPVLDFIKASQDEKSNATIAIMCSDSAYGNGLRLVLQNLSKHRLEQTLYLPLDGFQALLHLFHIRSFSRLHFQNSHFKPPFPLSATVPRLQRRIPRGWRPAQNK